MEDNWTLILKESEKDIGSLYRYRDGTIYYFFGLVHGEDDYYYGFSQKGTGKLFLASCVGNMTTNGFEKLEGPRNKYNPFDIE